ECRATLQSGLPFVMGTTGGDRDVLYKTVQVPYLYAVIYPRMGKHVKIVMLLRQDSLDFEDSSRILLITTLLEQKCTYHTGHVTVGSVMTSATINSGYRGPKVLGVPVEPSNPAKYALCVICLHRPYFINCEKCLGKRGMRHSSGERGEGNNETFASWDDNFGQFDDGNTYDSYSVSHVLILTVFVDLFQRSLLNRRLARTIGASSSSSSPSFVVLRRGSERASTTMVLKFSPVTWNAVHFDIWDENWN
ncbi:dihydrodipicolinate reductase, partial [Tanacetum coccineum]